MKVSNFKTSKLTNHEVYKKLVLTVFTEPIMHPVYSPKFCMIIVFSFPWDDCNTQGKLETMVMKNLGGRQGALVTVKIVTEVFKTMLTGSRLHFLLSPQPPRGFLRRQSDMGIPIPKTLVIPWSLGQARCCNTLSLSLLNPNIKEVATNFSWSEIWVNLLLVTYSCEGKQFSVGFSHAYT